MGTGDGVEKLARLEIDIPMTPSDVISLEKLNTVELPVLSDDVYAVELVLLVVAVEVVVDLVLVVLSLLEVDIVTAAGAESMTYCQTSFR